MFRNVIRSVRRSPQTTFGGVRQFHSSSQHEYKATVIGAAGGIGQPLSLLLNYNSLIDELSLYDVNPVAPGVAADIGHVNVGGKCYGCAGEGDAMEEALKDADIVVVPAGVPRQPGMTRADLFNINGGIVKSIAEACAAACPKAFFLIISNPVNSTVPIFAEVLKNEGVYDQNKLFGVTTLDTCRANTFVAESQDWVVEDVAVPVIGGHAGMTIIPLLSQVENAKFSEEELTALDHRIAFGGDEVVQAKVGNGSATLSMAHAAAVMTNQVLRAANGERDIVECCYVDTNLNVGADFFASPCKLGKNGVEEILPLPKLSKFEQKRLDDMLPELKEQIDLGVKFITEPKEE